MQEVSRIPSPEHMPEGSQCQLLSLKCPPPWASAACRCRGWPRTRAHKAPLSLAVPPKWPRHPTCPKAPFHPSPPILCLSQRQSQKKKKPPRHWQSISSPVAGLSAFPTNLGVQSLYRRLIWKSYTVFLKCTPTLYGSESSANPWVWWHLIFIKKVIFKLSNSLNLWKINMAD